MECVLDGMASMLLKDAKNENEESDSTNSDTELATGEPSGIHSIDQAKKKRCRPSKAKRDKANKRNLERKRAKKQNPQIEEYPGASGPRFASLSPNIIQIVQWVSQKRKKHELLALLSDIDLSNEKNLTLVFVKENSTASGVQGFLMRHKINSFLIDAYDDAALEAHLKGPGNVLLATNKCARTLNRGIPNLCHMIHYDMPSQIDNYVDHLKTIPIDEEFQVLTFFNKCDEYVRRNFETLLKENFQYVPHFLTRNGFKKMKDEELNQFQRGNGAGMAENTTENGEECRCQ